MKRRRSVWFQHTVLLAMPLGAFGLGTYFSNTAIGVLLILAEPFLFAALMAIAFSALVADHKALFLSTIVSGVLGASGLQQTNIDTRSPSDGSEQLRILKGCSILSKSIQAPIRIFVWTESQSNVIEQALGDILLLRPDIVIINGSDDPEIGSTLGDQLNGEVKFFPETKHTKSLTAIVRGSFQYCGGEEDVWNIPVDGDSRTVSNGVITFPHIDKIGVFPLLIPRLAEHTHTVGWIDWAQDMIDGTTIIAEASSVLGTRKLVVAGNTQTPIHTNLVSQPFQKVGLTPARSEPNWPTSIGGIPFLTLHTLDHAWVGSGWHIQSAKTIDLPNLHRKPVLFDLTPVEVAGS